MWGYKNHLTELFYLCLLSWLVMSFVNTKARSGRISGFYHVVHATCRGVSCEVNGLPFHHCMTKNNDIIKLPWSPNQRKTKTCLIWISLDSISRQNLCKYDTAARLFCCLSNTLTFQCILDYRKMIYHPLSTLYQKLRSCKANIITTTIFIHNEIHYIDTTRKKNSLIAAGGEIKIIYILPKLQLWEIGINKIIFLRERNIT